MDKNEVYAISGRIKNLIAMEDLALSPVGNLLVNSYTLVLKDLYDFADSLPNPYMEQLKKVLNEKETFPKNLLKLATPKKEESVEDEDDSV